MKLCSSDNHYTTAPLVLSLDENHDVLHKFQVVLIDAYVTDKLFEYVWTFCGFGAQKVKEQEDNVSNLLKHLEFFQDPMASSFEELAFIRASTTWSFILNLILILTLSI